MKKKKAEDISSPGFPTGLPLGTSSWMCSLLSFQFSYGEGAMAPKTVPRKEQLLSCNSSRSESQGNVRCLTYNTPESANADAIISILIPNARPAEPVPRRRPSVRDMPPRGAPGAPAVGEARSCVPAAPREAGARSSGEPRLHRAPLAALFTLFLKGSGRVAHIVSPGAPDSRGPAPRPLEQPGTSACGSRELFWRQASAPRWVTPASGRAPPASGRARGARRAGRRPRRPRSELRRRPASRPRA
ncbi:PREDICTED: translation initiation factor IF-2-like, partial [Chinchilla lanigera]|uniref:translation initiation factor IF-2-like n=1 Tax=Chinchilla lanigera TaxID=34839 RepID=UPI0006977814